MNVEDLRTYCLQFPFVTESFPFDDKVLVFKVCHKMFALTNIEFEQTSVNLKCNPEYAIILREQYTEITPGYHMNKKHWNTVNCNGGLKESFIKQLIDNSYELVINGLPKKYKDKITLKFKTT